MATATPAPTEEVLGPAPSLTEEEVKTIAEAKRVSLLEYMRIKLSKEPKRRVKVHAQGDVFVQINGYSILIQPNVPVEVPESVAQILEDGDYI